MLHLNLFKKNTPMFVSFLYFVKIRILRILMYIVIHGMEQKKACFFLQIIHQLDNLSVHFSLVILYLVLSVKELRILKHF